MPASLMDCLTPRTFLPTVQRVAVRKPQTAAAIASRMWRQREGNQAKVNEQRRVKRAIAAGITDPAQQKRGINAGRNPKREAEYAKRNAKRRANGGKR